MSINLTDEIEVKTKKGKLGAAKQIFLEGDMQTVENEIQNINSRHNTLNTKHESLSRTVQDIAVTGGASTANNVTYNNDASGLNAENAQDAIDEVSSMIIYDVSARNNGEVFESLQALLSSSNLNTLIPASVRHGGITIRFIKGSKQSSNNKYVQYRLMADSFSITVADWQGVDDEPTVGSDNLVKSGGVANKLAELEEAINGNTKTVKINLKGGVPISADGNTYITDFTLKAGKYILLADGFTTSVYFQNTNGIRVKPYQYIDGVKQQTELNSVRTTQMSERFMYEFSEDVTKISLYDGTPEEDIVLSIIAKDSESNDGLVNEVSDIKKQVSKNTDDISIVNKSVKSIEKEISEKDYSTSFNITLIKNVPINVNGNRYPTQINLPKGKYIFSSNINENITVYFSNPNGNVYYTDNHGDKDYKMGLNHMTDSFEYEFKDNVTSVLLYSSSFIPTNNVTLTINASDQNKKEGITRRVEVIEGKVEVIEGKELRSKMFINLNDTEEEIYLKLRQAIEEKNVDVHWEKGTYVFSSIYDIMRDKYGMDRQELPVGGNCRYFFNGAILKGIYPIGADFDSTSRNLMGCARTADNYELHDGFLYAEGLRYVFHDEANASPKQYRRLYHNMHFSRKWAKPNDNNALEKIIGGGTGEWGIVEFDGCTFNADSRAKQLITYHGMLKDSTQYSRFQCVVKNCYIDGELSFYDGSGYSTNQHWDIIVCNSAYNRFGKTLVNERFHIVEFCNEQLA